MKNNNTKSDFLQYQKFKKLSQQYVKLLTFDKKLSIRASSCSNSIFNEIWEHKTTPEIIKKTKSCKTCKLRFCPICNFTKVKKLTPQIVTNLERFNDGKHDFLLLTNSPKTVLYGDLRATIQKMNKAYNNMLKNHVFKKYCVAYIRTLEITFKYKNGKCHPHYHSIIVMKKEYFKSNDYLKTSDFAKLFNASFKADIAPMTDIRKIYKKNGTLNTNSIYSAVRELSKYITKATDLNILNVADMQIIHNELFKMRTIVTSQNIKLSENFELDFFDKELWVLIETIFFKYNKKLKIFEEKQIVKNVNFL